MSRFDYLSFPFLHLIHFHLYPRYTSEIVTFMFKFASNQLLVSSNLKCFNSASILPDNCITIANCYKSFFSAVEVYLQDKIFILSDNALNLSDLLGRIKVMSSFEVKFASLARLTIAKGESKCCRFVPLYLRNSQVFESL